MGYIDIGSIMGKVNAYAKSTEGKRRMDDKVKEYQRVGRDCDSGSKIIGADDMQEAASKLIRIVNDNAASYGLPGSVLASVSTLTSMTPFRISDNLYRIELVFAGDLSRESMTPSEYRSYGYSGIRNIVALFNNGYSARQTYGYWHGKRQPSKTNRTGLHFMQQSLNQFMSSYQGEYNIIAAGLGGDYQDG